VIVLEPKEKERKYFPGDKKKYAWLTPFDWYLSNDARKVIDQKE
jgi:hypothetical protein